MQQLRPAYYAHVAHPGEEGLVSGGGGKADPAADCKAASAGDGFVDEGCGPEATDACVGQEIGAGAGKVTLVRTPAGLHGMGAQYCQFTP